MGYEKNTVHVSYFIETQNSVTYPEPTSVPYDGQALKPGDVVEVEYVWVDKKGHLLEPKILRKMRSNDIKRTCNQTFRLVRNI
jgi:hypothetical protein